MCVCVCVCVCVVCVCLCVRAANCPFRRIVHNLICVIVTGRGVKCGRGIMGNTGHALRAILTHAACVNYEVLYY